MESSGKDITICINETKSYKKNNLFCKRMKTRALQCCLGDTFEPQGFALFYTILITEVMKLAV